jgi:hypothetical protein
MTAKRLRSKPLTKRTTETLGRLTPHAKRAASDRRLRRHLGSSARHLGLATSQMARRRRKDSLINAVTDRRAMAHLRASGQELRKAGGRLRRPRSHRVRNAVLLAGPALAAVSFLRRGRQPDPHPAAGLGAKGPLQGDVTTGGDPHAGMPGGHLAHELAEREKTMEG